MGLITLVIVYKLYKIIIAFCERKTNIVCKKNTLRKNQIHIKRYKGKSVRFLYITRTKTSIRYAKEKREKER